MPVSTLLQQGILQLRGETNVNGHRMCKQFTLKWLRQLALDRGDLLVEVEKASAGVWAADRCWLFNPDVRARPVRVTRPRP
jgi:hypothetical protein